MESRTNRCWKASKLRLIDISSREHEQEHGLRERSDGDHAQRTTPRYSSWSPAWRR
jgi:hypothetical protein